MVLMLGVIFGGIALLAMGNLHGTLLNLAAGRDWPGFAAQVFFAAGFLAFFAYAAGRHFLLAGEYPYNLRESPGRSGARFLLDLGMAFLLYVMLLTVTGREPQSSTLIVFSALVLWHLGAMAWRGLASLERDGSLGVREGILPHLGLLGAYVALLFIWGSLFIGPAPGYRKSFDFLWVLCLAVFLAALWRARNLGQGPEPARGDPPPPGR